MRSRKDRRLLKLSECFVEYSTDPERNIHQLTMCCGELMGADCALYNRVCEGMLHTLAAWNAPSNMSRVDRPDGHICHDLIKSGGNGAHVLRDLQLSAYAESDPNVSAYGLKTYIDAPVNCNNHCVGSLCVVYRSDYSPDEVEKRVIHILASALGVEEEGREEAVALQMAKMEMETWVEERTAQLAIANQQLRIEISRRKQVERELIRAKSELKKKTAEYLEAREEMLRSEELAGIGRLAGNVGHELRNPLGVTNNAVFFLQTVMPDADEAIREYLEIIRQEIDNSQRIITDLLDFSCSRKPNSIQMPVGELVWRNIEKCAIPENISLETRLPGTLPLLKVDPLQIGQVLQNLIINGIQAMPEGGIIFVSACYRKDPCPGGQEVVEFTPRNALPNEKDDGFIEISVTDTGVGILPENMGNLFQPLFTTKTRGIGLGLTVCKNLTEANGGKIRVESRPGAGSTFTLILPTERHGSNAGVNTP